MFDQQSEQREKQYREHQDTLREQLAISAELGNIQVRLHSLFENLLDRSFLNRNEVRRLFKTLDPPIASLIFELQKFVVVKGNLYAAPEIELPDAE